jgi:sporulation protein YlmC with PRC-barrel domain
MARQEIHLELLLGKRVYALNGRAVGRIEDARADMHDGSGFVNEFLIGTYSFFERLSAWEIGRAILGVFGSTIKSGYRVRWDQIDFSNWQRPSLTCEVSDLSPLEKN